MAASFGLVLLILLSLFAPLSQTAADPTPYITSQIDGSGSVIDGATSQELEEALFPYRTVIERSAGSLQSAWPPVGEVLQYEPTSLEVRRAIVGQLFASSTGSLEIRIKDSGLAANPDPTLLDTIAIQYQGMFDTNKADNGLAALSLLVSLIAPDEATRHLREREAIYGFQRAAGESTIVWQYTYNWGLANLVAGNYLPAYEAMRVVGRKQETTNFKLIEVWQGIAALRMGEYNEAVTILTDIVNNPPPAGSAENVQAYYAEARDLAREALGDAQWARRDTATAYRTYLDGLLQGSGSYGLYRKWLRLGLEQRAYERMLGDMSALADSGIAPDLKIRVRHDRARLLGFLGRDAEAASEFQALVQGEGANDSALLISYAQSLLSGGDTGKALAQAEGALRILQRDLSAGDMVAVAGTVLTTTSTPAARYSAQQTLDAHLVRAMAWARQGNTGNVDNLVANITGGADAQPVDMAGILYLYGGYMYEAAARVAGGGAGAYYAKAADAYGKSWAKLKDLTPGQVGRATALTGQARTIALATGKSAADGLAALKSAGYDPVAIAPSVARDRDASEILHTGALLLQSAGQPKEAANAFRVAGVVSNLLDIQSVSGVGRPLWSNNGTPAPAALALRTADALRAAGADPSQVVFRYKQAFWLDPALAPAWNNLGVFYTQQGNPAGKSYLELATKASPAYVLASHNLATAAYRGGIGNFLTAEAAQGAAIKASGPSSLRWGYSLRYDERGPLPAPGGPPADFYLRAGALVALLLLLLHTLVGHDRMTNRMGLVPTRGLIGRAAALVDARAKAILPGLVPTSEASGMSSRSLVIAVLAPAVIGTIALAWAAGHGTWEVALVFVPVALLLAVLSFGANEVAQRRMARRSGAATMHHVWPTGLLLGILSIPFGFMYGWGNVTRLSAGKSGSGDMAESSTAASAASSARRARTTEESDLLFEARAEAAADTLGGVAGADAPVAAPSLGGASARGGRFGLATAGRIFFAGAVANLALALVFGALYWLTGWPSMRLGLFASSLVLAFTSVSEPPADGWTLYRRNAPLWLAVFLLAATLVTLLAVGII